MSEATLVPVLVVVVVVVVVLLLLLLLLLLLVLVLVLLLVLLVPGRTSRRPLTTETLSTANPLLRASASESKIPCASRWRWYSAFQNSSLRSISV
jgi:hypothetical protein